MLDDYRIKVLKKLKASTQARLGWNNPPKYNGIRSEEMQILWTTFSKSNQFKGLIPDSPKPVNYNFNASMMWLNFLQNHHIDTPIDPLETVVEDMSMHLKVKTKDVLHNLRMYKVLPHFKISNVSYQLVLPSSGSDAQKMNTHANPKVLVLFEYVPAKSRVVDLAKQAGPKMRTNSVDFLMDTHLDGYLFNRRDRWLKYTKPLDAGQLMSLPEYSWFYKKTSGLRFRHNGNSLAVRVDYTYPGVLPMSGTDHLLRNFDKIMSRALRAIQ